MRARSSTAFTAKRATRAGSESATRKKTRLSTRTLPRARRYPIPSAASTRTRQTGRAATQAASPFNLSRPRRSRAFPIPPTVRPSIGTSVTARHATAYSARTRTAAGRDSAPQRRQSTPAPTSNQARLLPTLSAVLTVTAILSAASTVRAGAICTCSRLLSVLSRASMTACRFSGTHLRVRSSTASTARRTARAGSESPTPRKPLLSTPMLPQGKKYPTPSAASMRMVLTGRAITTAASRFSTSRLLRLQTSKTPTKA